MHLEFILGVKDIASFDEEFSTCPKDVSVHSIDCGSVEKQLSCRYDIDSHVLVVFLWGGGFTGRYRRIWSLSSAGRSTKGMLDAMVMET